MICSRTRNPKFRCVVCSLSLTGTDRRTGRLESGATPRSEFVYVLFYLVLTEHRLSLSPSLSMDPTRQPSMQSKAFPLSTAPKATAVRAVRLAPAELYQVCRLESWHSERAVDGRTLVTDFAKITSPTSSIPTLRWQLLPIADGNAGAHRLELRASGLEACSQPRSSYIAARSTSSTLRMPSPRTFFCAS